MKPRQHHWHLAATLGLIFFIICVLPVAAQTSAGITLSRTSLSLTEAGGPRNSATVTVVLNTQPTGNVTVSLRSPDRNQVYVTPLSMTFTPGNWNKPKRATIIIVEDVTDHGSQPTMNVDFVPRGGGYNSQHSTSLRVQYSDNDTAGVTVTQTAGSTATTEAGGTDTINVVLDTQPTSNVTIAVSSSDTTEGTVAPVSLTFTAANWNKAKTITVTGVDDHVVDGDKSYNIVLAAAVSRDGPYNGIDPSDVSVTNTDNDTVGVTLSKSRVTVTEAPGTGRTATYTVKLNTQPSGNVTVKPISWNTGVATVLPASLTFTSSNWNKAQQVTVTGVDDSSDKDRSTTITHKVSGGGYGLVSVSNVSVTLTDDDTVGVTLSKTSVTVTEASGSSNTATYTVKLNTQPSGNVTVKPISWNTGVATVLPASLTFTSSNWNKAQQVTVTGVDDSSDGDRSTTITHTASGGGYDSVVIRSVSVTLTDDDRGVTLSKTSVTVTEAIGSGRSTTYTLVLDVQPDGDVTITPASSDTGVATVSPASLTFTTSSWNTAQAVTVTGVDDNTDRDRSTTITHAISGGGYGLVSVSNVSVTLTDDDTASVTLSKASVTVTEASAGRTATYTVKLNTKPSDTVTVTPTSSDTGVANVSPATLTFTTSNWNTAQAVTVTGVDDAIDSADLTTTISHSASGGGYDSVSITSVSVTLTDDDTAGVTVTATDGSTATTEAGGTDTINVVLDTEPGFKVAIAVSSSDPSEGTVDKNILVFTSANWNKAQTITVTGQDDSLADGDQLYNIVLTKAVSSDGNYSAIDPPDVSVTNTDDDAGVTLSESSVTVTEASAERTNTYTVVLDAQPSDTVTVTPTSSDTGVANVSPATLTFTTSNWNTAQAVTVTGVDDAIDSADLTTTISHSASGGGYDSVSISSVSVTLTDNDTAGVTVSETGGSTATTEAGGTDTFTVVLNTEPLEGVRIAVSSSDISEGTVDKSSLLFTAANWSTAQTVTVTGQDDNLADGDKSYNIVLAKALSADPQYGGTTRANRADAIDPPDVSVTNADDDTAGVTVTETDDSTATTEAGGTDTINVVLDTQPVSDVTIAVSSSDTTEGRVNRISLVFTRDNWDTPQTVTVTGIDDSLVDGDKSYKIVLAAAVSSDGNYNGIDPSDVSVTNTDDDTSFTFSTSSLSLAEGGLGGRPSTGSYTVKLNERPNADVTVTVRNNFPDEITVSPASLTFTTSDWNTAQQVTVTVLNNQVDNGDQRTIFVWHLPTGGGYGSQQNTNITVRYNDNDTAGVTVAETDGSTATTEAGSTDTFTVVLDTEPLANVRIAVSSSDITEGTVNKSSLVFTDSNWSTAQTVTVTGVDDNLVDGDRPYNIVLAKVVSTDTNYHGIDPADVSVTNTDDDAGVTVSESSVTVTEASGNSNTATYTVVLDAQPSGEVTVTPTSGDTSVARVSPASLTFTTSDWNTAQQVTVTGIDDSTVADRSTTITHAATGGGYNAVVIPSVSVTLTDDDTSFTFSTSSLSLAETAGLGGLSNTGSYTVKLNGAPIADVTVTVRNNFPDEITVSPASLTFTTSDWNTPQRVTITVLDNQVDNGDQRTILVWHLPSGGGYGSQQNTNITVQYNDNDTAGVTVTETGDSTATTEAGGTDTFTVVLNTKPLEGVRIAVSSSDISEGTVDKSSLVFTDSNWDTVQTVTVTGQDDSLVDGDRAYNIVLAKVVSTDTNYHGIDPADVSVTNTDDDAGVTLSKSSVTVTEASGNSNTNTYTVVLDAQPSGEVTVTLTSGDTSVARVSPASLTFTTSDWNTAQQVTVTGIDDSTVADRSTTITHAASGGSYNAVVIPSVSVTLTDDDTSFTFSTSSLSLAETAGLGGLSNTGSYTVKLNGAPNADVTVTVRNNLPDEITVSPASLTFTTSDWNTPQRVTVTVLDNQVDNGDQRTIFVWHLPSGGGYGSQQNTNITVQYNDNDTAGVTVTETGDSTATTEAGGTDTINVVLNTEPLEGVRIAVSSSDISEGTVDKSSLTFTAANWDTVQTVTVTGQDDSLVDGDRAYNIVLAKVVSTDTNYHGIDPADVSVTNTDDDAGVTLSKSSVTVTEASGNSNTNTYTVVLDAQPSGTVTVTLTSGDTSVARVSPASLTFTTSDWNTAQQVTVTGVDDSTDEDRSTTITHTISGGGYGSVSIADVAVTLTDDDTARVTPPSKPTGLEAVGGDSQVTLTWNNPNNAAITGYQIRQRSYVNGAWTKFPKFSNIIPGSDASTTSHVVSGLTNGVRYSFQIREMVGKKGGKPSEAKATPAAPPPPKPSKPTGLRTVAGNNQATLIWNNPNNAAITKYQYKQWNSSSTESGAKWADIPGSDANTTSYVVSGLTNTSVIYRFRIRAVAGPSVGLQSSSAGAIIAVPPAAPVVTATPGDAQVRLSWSGSIGYYITRYQIKQWTGSSEPANGWKDIPGSRSSTTSHVVRGLTSGVSYSFRIRAVATCSFNSGRFIASDCSVAGTPSTPVSPTLVPGKPVVAPMPGDAQVTLSWSNPNDVAITKYQIKQWTGSSESGSWTDISGSGSSTTSHVVSGLTSGVRYSFRIRAVAGTNVAGTPSDPVRAVLLDKPVVSASAGDTLVTLSWSDPNDDSITRYQIKQWTGSSERGRWTDISGSGSSTTSLVVGRLTNGVRYSFRIRAMVGLFPGVESASVSSTPVPGKPAVTATPGTAQVTLSWSNPNDASIARYQIKQWTGSSESGSWTDISGSGEDTTSHVVRGLTNGVEYSFRIRAVTGTNASGTPSDPVSETPAVQPDKPAVTAAPAGDSLVRLSWSNPNDASITGYQIKRWTGSSESGSWTDISGSGKDTITYTVPGLTNGVEYSFRIRAMAGRVPGMESDVASATPVADKPIVTATPGNALVTLSWSNPNDASITGYQIKQWTGSSESGSWTDISGSGEDTISHVVSGLTNGARYGFRIRAMVGAVTRTPSDPVSATPVSPPVGLTATPGDSQVTLTWNNPNNPTITGYQLKKYRFTIETGFNEGSWTDIPGSGKDTTSYVVTSLTNGARYGFEIRAVVGSVTGEESEFVPVTLSSIFTITGTVTQGETLTADTSTISDPDGPKSLTFTYQWKRGGTAIGGATGRTYVLTQADVGKAITVIVSWTNARGTLKSLTSTATANVANVNESPTGAVTITGTATRGQTLTADTSTIVDPDGPARLTFTYQWNRGGTAIGGATGRTYVLTPADVGKAISVTVSWTDAGSTAESFISAATTSVTNTNQSPTGAVAITGTATQKQTLTAVTSTIVDPDGPSSLTFSYQWNRDGSAISSATGSTYVLTQADVGAKITVTVSWTDAGSTAESFNSAATAKVANVNDLPTGAVTITGTVTQKQTLTAVTSTISDPDGPSNLVFSYQWKRDGNNISSATGRTYVLTQADVGKAIIVTVSWTDAYGASESLTSAATAKVVNVNDRPTGAVTITGTPIQGQILTADTSGISDPDVPDTDSLTFTYQWTRGPDTVSRTSTYTLTQADVGEIITVVVAYQDGGRRQLFLARTPKVANLNDAPTGAVTITGTPTQGETLTAVTSTISDPDGPSDLVFSYQWKRDRIAISSATGSTYTLTQADVGKAISVIVSWTDAGSTAETLTSVATASVTNINDSPTGSVTITGTVTQGQTLTADTSGISDPDGPASLTFSYQWKRDGSDISSATSRTYILTQADVGKAISVTVSWTDAGSIVETLTSAATANVANLNDSPTGSVTISGTVTQGQTLTAVTSTIVDPDGPASLTFSYQWKRDSTDISSATSRTYILTQADVGKAITVIVSWTDAGSIVETLTSTATAKVANMNDPPTGAVTISGTVTQGQTLTAVTSTIVDPDGPSSLTFTYQWNRGGNPISSATGSTYTLTQADVGKAISVIVSWTDAGSTAETLTSAATANVTNANDPPTGAVTISGTVTQGQTLTADTSGISDPDGPSNLTFTYQWKRDGSDISSATSRTYILTQADVGKAITVIVSWTDAGSIVETLTSAATANVANLNDSPTGSVTISGTVTQGQTLTAVTSTIVDPDGPASLTFSYQWKRDSTDISSATSRTYILTQADVGKAITVIVSWTDAGSIVETLTSTATAKVANMNDPPTGAVTISGTVTQGQTLTAVTSTIVDPDGPSSLTFTYQWNRGGNPISSATGSTYTLTQADVGKAISVTVSWTDAGSIVETLTSAATANVTNANDPPTGAVTITGTVTQGQTLTADTSTIVDPDGPASLTFSYQWKRDSTDISSATSRTYILTQADVGKAITVIVSWTDAGSIVETLTSAATANVANLNDSPTGSVTISGTVTQGQTLTAVTSTIVDPDGPASLTFSYQWKRDSTDISSATSRTYILTQADVGKAITVIVSWTDAGSIVETLTSTATAKVANMNDPPTGAVTISGTVTQGQTLTAVTSTIVDPDGPSSLTFTYQWNRGGNPISSATGSTYTLTQADVGKAISVTVSWTDAGSIVETLTSAATANVTNANDPPTGAVTITGTVTQGQTLTADTSTIVDPDGPASLTFSYQWKRDSTDISSATSRTYILTQADVGKAITVIVSWTDAGSIVETLTSTATAKVANMNDPPTGAVTISGTVTQGQTLTADTSGISDPDGPSNLTFTYQWNRGGNPISSATGSTYTLTQADVGKAISVTVSWTDAGSIVETLTSAATANVTNANDPPTGAVTITGTVTQGQTLTADTSTIVDPDGPASLTFSYQWKRDSTDISSATSRTYILTQADVGAAISVAVSWTDAGSIVETLTSDATANVANLNDSPTGSVTISGTVTQGQTLTAVTSTIVDPDGPASLTFSYQWKRDSTDISSATSRTYILTQADVGAAISVAVSWTDAGSIVETLTSTATAKVANMNDPPTGAVTISGTVTQGQTLTAVTSTIVDPDGPSSLTFTYQWNRGGNPISSATGSTYTLTQADVGKAISVTVSWTDAGSIVETLTSAATANVTNANDPPTGAVTITGTVTQGQTLTADTSGISDPDGPSNLTFTYQWKRDGSDISSATSRTYVLTQADVGKAISVIVSWTDAGSTAETLTSAATANVTNANDPPTGAVTITGTVTQGQTLTADTSTIVDPDGPANLTFTYQWKRDGSDISSATSRTYVLTQADVGKAISVIVSWTDAGSTVETLTSAATANVTNANDPPTGSVTISGTVTQGQTLTADTSTIVDPDGPASLTFTYQWKRDGSDISSATSRTYILTQADVGKAITVIVSWTDAGSIVETLTSAATAKVVNVNDPPTGSVTITGTVTQGQTLTADTSTIVDPDGPASLTFTYQWKRDGSDISSATSRTYVLTQADVGKAISVIVSWTDAGSTVETLTSAATANVTNANDPPTGSVTISGTVTQGQTLTADTSTIVDPDGPANLTFTYQWKRDGSDISSATSRTYVLTQADVGKAISVIVSWTDAGSTVETLTSAATANVTNANDPPTGSVTISGTVTQGQTLTADTSTIVDPDGPASLTFTYQWKRDGSDISSATSRTYILTQADVGKAITVIVSWTDAGSIVETLTSAATAKVVNVNDPPTGSVTITGTVTQGQTLTADTSTIVDPDGPASLTFTYQWKRDGSDISSATSRTYVLTQADVGKAISVIVSWTDAGSTAETLTSAATANVTNANDPPTGAVTITGTVTQGQTLTADTSGISDPDGPSNLTFSYQWKRDGSDISSATSRTYVLTQADVGKAISVIVSWTDAGSTAETLTSDATANVTNANDPPTGAVTITGTVTQGQTLTADTSGISDPDGPSNLTFSYQWKRDGSDISSATSRTYVLTQADVGKAITVTVSWTDSGGTAETLTSAATSVAGVTLSTRAVTVTEASGSSNTNTYTVVLDTQPSGNVTVTPTSGDSDVATVSPVSLTFTTSNWSTAQIVTVTGVDDSSDGDRSTTITHAASGGGYDSVVIASVSVTLTDDDTAGVTVSESGVTVTEASGSSNTNTYTVVLNTRPSGNVTVTPTSGDTNVATVSGALTFTTSNWSTAQSITVTGVDDSSDGDRSTTITHAASGGGYNAVVISDVAVTLTDDDTAGVTVSESSVTVTEASGSSNTNTYTVKLNTRPSGTVTVTPTSGDSDVATVSPVSLTFTTSNWGTAQSITVTGVDDSSDGDRSTTITHAASGGGYNAVVISDVAVTLTDDDNNSPTGSVTITGAATQGQRLTADTSTIVDPDGPSNLTFSYQWKRGGTDISGATSSTYVLTQADVGSMITVVVSWTDSGSTVESLTSAATASVANLNDLPTGAVTITGTVTQGQTLTADTGTIVDPDGPSNLTFSYQWKRGGTDINGATSSTYVLTQADVGSVITVVVSWTDAGGASESLTSAATASVANTNNLPTGAVTITGTVTQGQTLTADTGTIVDPDGPSSLTFSYQWKRGGTDISGATSSTYVLTQADVGSVITVVVSWTDSGSTVETLTSAATASVANVNDLPTGAVTITGTATQGQTLTADTSTIVDPDGPSNLTFSYQWKRGGTDISGATSSTYVLTQADVGSVITVVVSWTDSGSTVETLTSAATASVANVNDSPTGAVTITGTATQGQTLTADTSTIVDPDGPSNLTFSYQWKRGGTDISGGASSTYVLTQADVGAAITVTVSWTDAGGASESLTSAATASVANVNDLPTGAVTITGTATQGQTLTADTSTIVDPDGPSNLTFSYQWKRGGTDISGATSSTYILTQADVGSVITVVVSWTDAGGTSESLTSAATASVANVNDLPTGAVTITGTATQGQTLTADTGTIVDPDGPSSLTFSYQWKRGGTDINGATSSTYIMTQADVGSVITVVVSWTDSGSTVESLTSAATASVANVNDSPTGAVTITGTATQGQTLTADTGTIVDPDGPSNLTFSYQWKRGGTDISGATTSTYVLTQADVGSVITVVVSWTDAGGASESLTSTATAKVINISGADSGTIIDVVEDGGRSIITATVDETAVKLTLPSGHGVTEIEFSPAAPTVTEPSGVSFGGKPSYVDIDLDVELSSSSSAIVCLEEPEELSGNLSVYHLADVEGAGWRKLPSPASVPSGYVCGKTSSFSTFVLGSPKPTFGSESIGDYVWTVGVEVVDVVLPEATGGDGVITYSLRPSLPLDLKFNDDSPRAITGKPTEALAKTKFTYKAEDVDGDTSELSFSITVRAAEEKERARVLSVVLASFGRAAATGAVDVIGERFVSSSSLAGSPKLTLGGVSMTSFDTRSVAGAVDGVLGLSGGSDIELLEGLDREPVELRRVSGRDLFAQSEFSIPLSSSGDMGGVMRGWTLWGSGAGSGFSGSNLDGDIDTEGELYTGYMGLDYRFGNRGLAGVAISRSVGEVDYEVDGSFHLMGGETGSIRGEVDLELTSVLPYAHYTIRPGLSIWGLFGAGIGDIELEDGAGEVEADVNMLMVALGVRQELARWGDIDFGLKSDGFAVQLKTEGVEGLSGVSGVARRLRLGLEMSRDVYVTGDSLLLPSVEIGGRWDGGDADSGVGMEVGGGIEYVHRGLGLSVEVRGRYLLFHEESEFEDWGGSFSLRMGDGVRGRGLWLKFEPEWGEVASGVERMWRGEVDSGLGVGKRGLSPGRVKFDVGYGMETRGSGWLVTPYSGVSIMREGEREYRLGGKVGVGEWMDISLEGERREVSNGVVDHGILLWWKLLL